MPRWLSPRHREADDLRNDPRFDYMVGHLVGAAEMMSFYMSLHGDAKAKEMARRLNHTIQFFVEPTSRQPLPELTVPEPAEEETWHK